MANGKPGVVRFRHLLLGLGLVACGGALGQRTAGGESHFLRQCEDDCGPGLECVSGVCTRGCLVGEDKCTDLSATAECTDASIEPGALAVCDVSCSNEAGCASFGAGFVCAGGFCRGPVLSGQEPPIGTGGDGGSGATAGTGTGAVSTGGQPASGGFYDVPSCNDAAREADLNSIVGGTPCPDGMACIVDDPTLGRVPPAICVGESAVAACAGGEECIEGFVCVEGNCSPRRAQCAPGSASCEVVEPPACSYGYARSFTSYCYGPCVPVDRCACENDEQCPAGAQCVAGSCQQPLPWQPPNECALPFDDGPCDALFPVFAFVDGACRAETYGGCEGNANRFSSLETCMAVCEGSPVPNPCPAGRIERIMCIECGPADGCAEWATVCAESCTIEQDCSAGTACVDGACSVVSCG